MEYQVCDGETFGIDSGTAGANSLVDTDCITRDHLAISDSNMDCDQGGNNGITHNRYCGDKFNPVRALAFDTVVCGKL